MKIKIAAMICGVLGLPGVTFGQHDAQPATTNAEQSITGDWVIHFQAGHESVSGSLHLQADGERLAGTVETGHTGPGTVENGKWSKQKLEATLVFKKHESVVLEGELKAESLDIELDGAFDVACANNRMRFPKHGASCVSAQACAAAVTCQAQRVLPDGHSASILRSSTTAE